MTEPQPSQRVRQALARIDPHWDATRTEHSLAALPERRSRRTRQRAGLALAGALVATLAWLALPDVDAPGAGAPEAVVDALQLRDGSRVTMLEPSTRVTVGESSAQQAVLTLEAGRARFQVTRRPERAFRVRAGNVTVDVLGTTFELTRAPERTHVRVSEGRVSVRWGEQRRELSAGEASWFPPEAPQALQAPQATAPASEPTASEDAAQAAPVARRKADRRPAASKGWRDHAEQGEFKRAYRLLQQPDARVAPSVRELLLAADAARLSGHPREAIPYLRRVIDEHPKDARAPLAAFTLGGVLMNQLGLPREAEAAYATARERTRSPALAQDALARQVEAAHRAGDGALARKLAERYAREYPDGRRLQAVRRFGNLP
ncbi:MAG: FecR domain-containing protein [Myxococcales bacterium]|nr:FecR domain-containing protein [Myxococcales bacterium]